MKNSISSYIIALIAVVMFAIPAVASELTAEADSAYREGRFNDAAQIYAAAIDSTGPSADLYYNLGNSMYRQGSIGHAVLNYERALRIDPTHSQAATNLEFVNSKIPDRPGERGTLLSHAIDSLISIAVPNAWAWIAFALFLITLGAVALYCFSTRVALRKIGFFGAIVMFFVTCVGIFIAVEAASAASADDVVVITAPTTILSSSPRVPANPSEEVMLLHEGTKLRVLDSVNRGTDESPDLWLDVEVDNERRAWVQAQDVERI